MLEAHINELKNFQKSTASVDFAANVSATTSFPALSHEDARVKAQLNN